ncbi:MAG: M48 family metallopeptidase [Fidelibacterota bacterium]
MNISVRPFKGVRIAVPRGIPFKEAEKLAHLKFHWIKEHVRQIKEAEKRLASQPPDVPLDEAKEIINGLVAKFVRKFGFSYHRVSVKSMKSRWGSCSVKNNINLNVKILRLPDELRDYIILHELVHTKHKNHSHLFWKTLNTVCGVEDAKQFNRQLKNFGIGII